MAAESCEDTSATWSYKTEIPPAAFSAGSTSSKSTFPSWWPKYGKVKPSSSKLGDQILDRWCQFALGFLIASIDSRSVVVLRNCNTASSSAAQARTRSIRMPHCLGLSGESNR